MHARGVGMFGVGGGRTPSHLMSGVVRLMASYDMFFEPFM